MKGIFEIIECMWEKQMFTLKTSENAELCEKEQKFILTPFKDSILNILMHFLPVCLCESTCLIF